MAPCYLRAIQGDREMECDRAGSHHVVFRPPSSPFERDIRASLLRSRAFIIVPRGSSHELCPYIPNDFQVRKNERKAFADKQQDVEWLSYELREFRSRCSQLRDERDRLTTRSQQLQASILSLITES